MNREIAKGLSPELRDVLEPLSVEIESLNKRIAEYDRRIEQIAKEVYPEAALLQPVKGVGTRNAFSSKELRLRCEWDDDVDSLIETGRRAWAGRSNPLGERE